MGVFSNVQKSFFNFYYRLYPILIDNHSELPNKYYLSYLMETYDTLFFSPKTDIRSQQTVLCVTCATRLHSNPYSLRFASFGTCGTALLYPLSGTGKAARCEISWRFHLYITCQLVAVWRNYVVMSKVVHLKPDVFVSAQGIQVWCNFYRHYEHLERWVWKCKTQH